MSNRPVQRPPFDFLFAVALAILLLAACAAKPAPTAVPTATPVPPEMNMTPSVRSVGVAQPTPAVTGLQMALSEGAETAATPAPALVAVAQPLPADQVQAILDRLPPLTPAPADTTEFAVRATSLPAPRTGVTVLDTFPPPATPTPPEPAAGPVELLRYAPQGDVPLAPYLSVTFNQPMVALTGLQDLAAGRVPVKLSPEPPGHWRWVGTKTLMFEPGSLAGAGSGRFPMATEYTVEIPAGTASATGGTLSKTFTWHFTTPALGLASTYPNDGPHRRDPLLFAAFDQRIDPKALLEHVAVKAAGVTFGVRLATEDEVRANKTVAQLAANAGEARWLAFRADEPFPAATQVTVTFEPGAPSAEGPRVTEKALSFSFQTYGPLKVEETRCGWQNHCPPLAPWTIRFNNPLDDTAFAASMVRIQPELPGLSLNVYGDTLQIQGRSAGRTRYQVTLSADLPDQFGQTLGRDQTVTFDVGSAEPALGASGGIFVVLDPSSAKPTFSVFSINYDRLKARVYAVTPEDWSAFKAYLRDYWQEAPPTPPGREILAQTITVKGQADELTETAIDLSPALTDGLGQLIVVVEPDVSVLATLFKSRGQRQPVVQAWVQATRIGLDAAVDGEQMLAWANALTDGAPLAGVELSLQPAIRAATTDATGVARLPLPDGNAASLLVARQGKDVAILPANTYYWGDDGWQRQPIQDSLRWYVFDDRGMYRPGEEVHVKGWIRLIGAGVTGDVGLVTAAGRSIDYRLIDARGNEVLNGTADLNALGGFDLSFTLPDTVNLGYTSLQLTANGAGGVGDRQTTHPFQVQEFRRPEFEVKASASEGPHFVGGHATVEVAANYYAGGGLANADVTWQVTTRPGSFSPPNWDDFTFGVWAPWWRSWYREPVIEQGSDIFTGVTDASGIHRLRLDFTAVNPPQPTTVTAEATVMDVNRQAWTAATNLLVHPADLYVGLRSDRIFVQREEPLKIDAIVTDLDGNPVPGRAIAMRAARLTWKYQDGSWQEVEAAVQPCTVTSAQEPVRCTFETPEGGAYRISATITDDQGRQNRSEFTRWVSGGQRPPARQVEQEEVTLIPDRKEYQPGDVAEILVQAPFYPAEGLLTLRRSGIVSSDSFTMDEPSYTLRIPIEEAHIPNLYVQVDLVGAAPRTDDAGQVNEKLPKRPAYATGELDLSVPPLARTLALEVTPRDAKLEPGGTTTVDVLVRDAGGQPVEGAELAVVVVDEAVLALSGYQHPDPIAIFYSERSTETGDHHLRANIVLANPDELIASGELAVAQDTLRAAAPMAAPAPMVVATMTVEKAVEAPGGGAEGAPIAIRTDFDPLAVFAPAVPTDAGGRAQVEVALPTT